MGKRAKRNLLATDIFCSSQNSQFQRLKNRIRKTKDETEFTTALEYTNESMGAHNWIILFEKPQWRAGKKTLGKERKLYSSKQSKARRE